MNTRGIFVATALWMASFAFMLSGTLEYHEHGMGELGLWWGAWFAVAAMVATNILIVGHFADRNRDIQHEVIDFVAQAPSQVRRLR